MTHLQHSSIYDYFFEKPLCQYSFIRTTSTADLLLFYLTLHQALRSTVEHTVHSSSTDCSSRKRAAVQLIKDLYIRSHCFTTIVHTVLQFKTRPLQILLGTAGSCGANTSSTGEQRTLRCVCLSSRNQPLAAKSPRFLQKNTVEPFCPVCTTACSRVQHSKPKKDRKKEKVVSVQQ